MTTALTPLAEATRLKLERVVDTRGLDFLSKSVRLNERVIMAALADKPIDEVDARRLEAWTNEFVEIRAL